MTVWTQEKDLIEFRHEGRDFFSFLIHDLVHAQLMTVNAQDYALQIKFARFIQSQWDLLYSNSSAVARTELEYMASDMNSHIVHLTKTFKSWVERHHPELRRKRDWFASLSDEAFNQLWDRLEGEELDAPHRDLYGFWQSLKTGQLTR